MAAKSMPDAAHLRECLSYDPETGVLTWKVRPLGHFPRGEPDWKMWNAQHAGRVAGTDVGGRYLRFNIDRVTYKAHRIIWKMQTGVEPAYEVDHWDHDGKNNRWDNLRSATRQQNQYNQRKHRDAEPMMPKGVRRKGKRFEAWCSYAGRARYLGSFTTPEEAHGVWQTFASKVHGEFFNNGKE